jgi:hypothetical protein
MVDGFMDEQVGITAINLDNFQASGLNSDRLLIGNWAFPPPQKKTAFRRTSSLIGRA